VGYLTGSVLIIEDERQVARFLRITLITHGFRVIEATSGEDGLAQSCMRKPDLILLDLGLPDVDGVDVTRRLREWTKIPIIVISARDRERDKVIALDAGADDYMTKPFGADELLARIRVALRHAAEISSGTTEPAVEYGDLRIDLAARRIFARGEEVHLTPTEYKLLVLLLRHIGKVVTHRQMLTEVWGESQANQTEYLRVYMRQLRHKLERDPAQPRYFLNEPGVGYRMRAE
jgi:two-component system KDP operon response regulator KdpE